MANDLLIGIHAVEAALQYDASHIVELYIESGAHNAA
jgi:23S rRNA (guanosine2251-2'-O)-methyltransferase